jgi:hypothetical protein
MPAKALAVYCPGTAIGIRSPGRESATMTTLTRREFLKLVFGSVSAAALTGPLALLWPEPEKTRPLAEPLGLYLDEDHHLVDGPRREDLEWVPILPREHLGLDRMSPHERVDFWVCDWGVEDPVLDALSERGDVENWSAPDHAAFAAFEAEHASWLDADIEFIEASEWELAMPTEYGAALRLHRELGEERAEALGLYGSGIGGPGGGGPAIGFRGDVAKLNAALAAAGLNVVVHECVPWEDEKTRGPTRRTWHEWTSLRAAQLPLEGRAVRCDLLRRPATRSARCRDRRQRRHGAPARRPASRARRGAQRADRAGDGLERQWRCRLSQAPSACCRIRLPCRGW